MKPTLVADEMFPEGAGPFMELDEVSEMCKLFFFFFIYKKLMTVVQQAGGSNGLLMDLAANEKDVHSDFYNGMT